MSTSSWPFLFLYFLPGPRHHPPPAASAAAVVNSCASLQLCGNYIVRLQRAHSVSMPERCFNVVSAGLLNPALSGCCCYLLATYLIGRLRLPPLLLARLPQRLLLLFTSEAASRTLRLQQRSVRVDGP